MASQREETYQITRITCSIPNTFEDVVKILRSSINKTSPVRKSANNPTSSKEAFEEHISSLLGPHGFMEFHAIDHGRWLPLFGVHGGRKALRIIFGNPFIALTMIKHDISAGLFLPVEALLIESHDGRSTDVVYVKPSTLVAGSVDANPDLMEAAEALDQKLEALWEFVQDNA